MSPDPQKKIALGLLLLACAVAPAGAQLRILRTDELDLVYYGTTRYLVPHAARCFENAYEFHHATFGWAPSEPVMLFLHDFYDHGNAAATSVPRNGILAAIAPFSYAFEVIPGNEHINWMLNHELVHVLASDMAADRDATARAIFHGKVYPSEDEPLSMAWSLLTSPRLYSPSFYHEGIASFMETWMAGGLGRAQGAYDEMAFRAMVRDGKPLYDLAGLLSSGTTVEFQAGANNYLYGTRLMSYLAFRYGPEKLIEWVARKPGTKPNFAAQFEQVFGMPLRQAWDEWTASEVEFQRANLGRLRANPVTRGTPITERALGSVSRPAYDPATGKIYLGVSYPGQVAHLAELDLATGGLRKLVDVKGAALFWVTSLALDPATRTLFYTTDNNNLRDLRALDLATGRSRLLQRDARFGDLAFDPADRSLWGVRHYNGISTLVRVPPPYAEWHQVWSLPYGDDIYSIDVSHDGRKLVAALTHVDGSQSLGLFEIEKLLAGETEPRVLGEFESSSPADFTFSADDGELYGSSFYSGVSNLYRYSFATGEIQPLTNAETGFFRPLPLADGRLFALEYTARGFLPETLQPEPVEKVAAIDFYGTEVVRRHPILQSWNIGAPSEIDLAAKTRYDGDFSIAGALGLASVYPVVDGYKDSAAAGVYFDFRDPVGLSKLGLSLSYSPDDALPTDERLHAAIEYRYFNWSAHASYNRTDFYDLFGPTKRGRKGYAYGFGWERPLIFDEPARRLDFYLDASGFGDLDTLPGFQNVASPVTELYQAETGLRYKSVRKSLGAIEDEEGIRLDLRAGDQVASGRQYPWIQLDLSAGTELPIEHSSLWLHGSLGAAFGDRANPLGNFYFGGFRNNYVDHLETRRFRSAFSFPGFEIDEIPAHRYAKAIAEWQLPPIRLRGGSPTAWLDWISVGLFGGGIVTDFDRSEMRRDFGTMGVQIDTRFTLRTHFKFTLSLGAAFGRELVAGSETVDEYMVSLKLPPL